MGPRSREGSSYVTAYLEMLARLGIQDDDLPVLRPVLQHRIWVRFQPGEGPGRLAAVIAELSAEDDRFTMDGGSWTQRRVLGRGYGKVLAPMERASSRWSQDSPAPGPPRKPVDPELTNKRSQDSRIKPQGVSWRDGDDLRTAAGPSCEQSGNEPPHLPVAKRPQQRRALPGVVARRSGTSVSRLRTVAACPWTG